MLFNILYNGASLHPFSRVRRRGLASHRLPRLPLFNRPGLFPRRGRQFAFLLNAIDQSREALGKPITLLLSAGPATSPTNAAVLVHQICIADLAVQQADGFADMVRDAAADKKVLVPVLLGEPLAQRAHKEPDEPRLSGIVLVVYTNNLCQVPALLDDLVHRRVGRFGDEAVGLLLGPLAAKDGYDGGLALEERRGVLCSLVVLHDGLAVQVREVKGQFPFEKARKGQKRLALVVLQIAPVAEIRS